MKKVVYGIALGLIVGVTIIGTTLVYSYNKPIKVTEERAKAVFETFITVEACKGLGMIDNAAESDLEPLMRRLEFYSSKYKQTTGYDLDKVDESVERTIIRIRQSKIADTSEGLFQLALFCNTEAEKASNYNKNYGA